MLNPNDQYKTNIVPHVSRSSPVVGPPGQGAPVKKKYIRVYVLYI